MFFDKLLFSIKLKATVKFSLETLINDALLFDILLLDKLPFSMKISSPVKVFRSLIRFLVGKETWERNSFFFAFEL